MPAPLRFIRESIGGESNESIGMWNVLLFSKPTRFVAF